MRDNDDRAIRGIRREQLRTTLTAEEERDLALLHLAIEDAKTAFDARLEDLYYRGVSQAAIARALGWSQARVGVRIQRHRDRVLRGIRPPVLR